MSVQIQLRRDTAANWTAANPTLAQGEAGFETDTYKIKFGDGVTAWNALAYFGGGVTAHGALTGLGDDDHPQYAMDTDLGFYVPKSLLTTRGDLMTRDATDPVRLGIGAANTVLGTDGTDPIWRTVATVLAALLTTRGDLVTRDAGGVVRKAIGAAYTRMMSDGTDPQWQTFKGFYLERSANQAIPANTDTAITWPTETKDTDNGHAANSAVYTIPAGLGGLWIMSGYVSFSSDGTGARHCWIGKNGAATQLGYAQAPSGTTQRGLNPSAVVWLAAGDTVELYVNTVGGTPNVNPAAFGGAFMGS